MANIPENVSEAAAHNMRVHAVAKDDAKTSAGGVVVQKGSGEAKMTPIPSNRGIGKV